MADGYQKCGAASIFAICLADQYKKITHKNHKDTVGCGNQCSAALQKIINRLMLVNPIAFERRQAFP
ncbi:hypothetical protein LGN07_30470 [Burkholderia cepacia]|uniref:hypothetical protein n=1 Tax=Burkholderia cepacia TaxID=292 RepID=UPI000A96EAB0|nr:hypothetical protein [Burkholderia cepacia]MCA8123058.1 hypothetical protein [Burkholderia cepacia]